MTPAPVRIWISGQRLLSAALQSSSGVSMCGRRYHARLSCGFLPKPFSGRKSRLPDCSTGQAGLKPVRWLLCDLRPEVCGLLPEALSPGTRGALPGLQLQPGGVSATFRSRQGQLLCCEAEQQGLQPLSSCYRWPSERRPERP